MFAAGDLRMETVISIRSSEATQALAIDLSVYSLPAVFSTAYKFTDRVFVYLHRDEEKPDSRLWVLLFAKAVNVDITGLVRDFMNELVDQQLRHQLASEFRDVRNLIVAQAFSEGNFLNPADDEADYQSDPRRAGQPR